MDTEPSTARLYPGDPHVEPASGHVLCPAIKGDGFPTAGTTDYDPDTVTGTTVIAGTYQGAPGNYRCTDDGACSAEADTGGAITLGGQWVFVHDVGAMVSIPDSNYLYFGWWLNKKRPACRPRPARSRAWLVRPTWYWETV